MKTVGLPVWEPRFPWPLSSFVSELSNQCISEQKPRDEKERNDFTYGTAGDPRDRRWRSLEPANNGAPQIFLRRRQLLPRCCLFRWIR
jgi:hypothetical protein